MPPDHGQLFSSPQRPGVTSRCTRPPTPRRGRPERPPRCLTAYLVRARDGFSPTGSSETSSSPTTADLPAPGDLIYRRLLEICQKERQIGSITFTAGVEPRGAPTPLVEALTQGVDGEYVCLDSAEGADPRLPGTADAVRTAQRGSHGPRAPLRIRCDARSSRPSARARPSPRIGTLRVFTSALLDYQIPTWCSTSRASSPYRRVHALSFGQRGGHLGQGSGWLFEFWARSSRRWR